MGTRYLTCVVKDGGYKIAQYGQLDGYPEGAGKRILFFLKEVNLETFNKVVSRQRFVTHEESEQLNQDIDNYIESLTSDDWEKFRSEDRERYEHPTIELIDNYLARPFIHFHRDLGWQILEFIMKGNISPLGEDLNFAGCSLHCEWVYVIDLDKNSFEVYRGFNKEPVPEGERFADFEGYNEFYPVKLLSEFDLENLPTEDDFLQECPGIQ